MIGLSVLHKVSLPHFDHFLRFFSLLLSIALLYGAILSVWSNTERVYALDREQGILINYVAILTSENTVCETDNPLLSVTDLRVQGSRRPTLPSRPKTAERALSTLTPPESIDPLIQRYASTYNLDPNTLSKIAHCESGYNPGAVNNVYGGMFQFLSSTWSATRKRMGEDPNPELRFNAEEAIKTAAFKISKEGTGAWPVCGKK